MINLDMKKMKESSRRIAFREFGDQNSEKILLCIPGILEGQNSFDELVNFVEQHEGCRLITVDHCGRGKSDWLDEGSTYKMSVYLEDLRTLITHIHATHKRLTRHLFLLGSSMGGILAMSLASQKELRVKGIVLNDVAMTVSWTGLYNLYNKIKQSGDSDETVEYLENLKFDPRLIEAVKSPKHVDIGFNVNFLGIHFHNALHDFEGPVLLIRGEKSDICTKLDEQVLKRLAKNAEVICIEGEKHPVHYVPKVLSKLSEVLNLHKTSASLSDDLFSTEYQKLDSYSMLTCA